MKCEFCKQKHNRFVSKSSTTPARYCSPKCIKRAWHTKNTATNKSYFKNREMFYSTETGIGFKWEKYIADKIGAEHLEFNKGVSDLFLNGLLIDVKACNLYKRKNKRGTPVKGEQSGCWIFNRNKLKPIDYFVCVCLINNKPHKILKIPSEEFKGAGINVGQKSKYDKFILV